MGELLLKEFLFGSLINLTPFDLGHLHLLIYDATAALDATADATAARNYDATMTQLQTQLQHKVFAPPSVFF